MLYNGRKVSNSFETIRFLEFNRSMMLLAYDFLRAGNLILKEEILLSHFRSSSSSIFRMRSMASSASSRGIVAIVGVGPKLGRCIARKFAHEGYTVAILARDLGTPPLSLLPSEVIEVRGRDSERGKGPSVRHQNRLLRLQKRKRGIRRCAISRIRGSTSLQCVPAGALASHQLHRHPHRFLPEITRRFLHRRLPLRSTGDSGNGGQKEGHDSLHRMFGFAEWHCRLLRIMLRKIRLESSITIFGEGVSATGRTRGPCYHRWCGRPTQGGNIRVAKIVSWGAPERRRGRVYGPRCGGSNLLALAHSGPGRLDPGDRPSSLPPQALLVLLPLYSFHLLCLSLHYFILPPRAPPPPLPLFPIFSPKVQAALSLKLISNVC
uniref:Uncharacterized protein n=1 Tax=Vitis vinifera TaxID=29760 RepID=F6HJH6_VITVI